VTLHLQQDRVFAAAVAGSLCFDARSLQLKSRRAKWSARRLKSGRRAHGAQ
jgi:hypothetical protein